jgi:hypothetical protein
MVGGASHGLIVMFGLESIGFCSLQNGRNIFQMTTSTFFFF